jgi:ferrous iron transport protein A
MSAAPIVPTDPRPILRLVDLPVGRRGRIVRILADASTTHYLRCFGLREGETAAVLRRALFGGPLHLERGCGGEFALAYALAALIELVVEA